MLTPNLAVKPATVMITKVTIKGAKQAVQMFGPAQYGVAKAVQDSVAEGVIPADGLEQRSKALFAALDAAVAKAETRKYGDAELIDRWAGGDPSPFIGVVLARWGMGQGGETHAPEPDFIVI